MLAGYADALRGAEDDAEALSIARVPLLSPRFSSPYPARARWSAEERDGLIEALQGIDGRRRAIAPDKFAAAWEAAIAAQRRFERTLSDGAEAVARWLAADRRRCAALLACRPYHIDPQVLHGIDGMLTRLGFAVLTPLAIEALARIAPDHPLVAARREDTGEPRAAWSGSKRLVGLSRIVAAHPQLHAVFLRSFGCVMDAVGLEEARGVLEASGKPFAVVQDRRHRRHISCRHQAQDACGDRRDPPPCRRWGRRRAHGRASLKGLSAVGIDRGCCGL